jgi:hypothetical protein
MEIVMTVMVMTAVTAAVTTTAHVNFFLSRRGDGVQRTRIRRNAVKRGKIAQAALFGEGASRQEILSFHADTSIISYYSYPHGAGC